ncbi:YqaJ viral recombinase family protein [Streptomyces carpinensis]|uniref:YqaJ viral recombinase family protein n=1 Tax=Streptomyces carpinensis TaxID=66369 RepID=A0ABV1VVR5_9ACTN|nr:YqaJ viral recombinase family protein [Streptomyces carpinensis]
MTTDTLVREDATEAEGLPDAPAARLILPSGSLDDPDYYQRWLATRREGIGGSDVAALFGLAGKYASPRRVYEEKHGRKVDEDNEYAEVGREIEGFIAHLFSKRSGTPIAIPPGTLQNIERPWMQVNVDRYALDPDTGAVVAPVECKNRSEYQIKDWDGDTPPDAPAIQCYWGMAVGGWDHGYVAGLVGGNKLRWFRLQRDEEIIGELVEHCEQWYQRHIVEGFPPPADGLEDTANLLARLWEVKPESIATVDPAKAQDILDRHALLEQKVKDAQDELRAVQNEMRLVAGANEIVKTSDGQVVWTNKQNGTLAPKRLEKERPDIAAKYRKTVSVLDVDALKTSPDKQVYTNFRARVLRVPSGG